MNVKETIEKLMKYPLDMRVVVDGYEGGYEDLTDGQYFISDIALNVSDSDIFGIHGEARHAENKTQIEKCLVLSRNE